MSGKHRVIQRKSLIRVHCKSGASQIDSRSLQTVMPQLRTIEQINELTNNAVKPELRQRPLIDRHAVACDPQPNECHENHALRVHRFKERERHKEINSTIDEMASVVPGVKGARKETRVVMLQRIIAYMYFMEHKTRQICRELNLGPEKYLHTDIMNNICVDEEMLENIPNLYSKDGEFNPLEYLYSFLTVIEDYPYSLTSQEIEAEAKEVEVRDGGMTSTVVDGNTMLQPIVLFTPPRLDGTKLLHSARPHDPIRRKLPFTEEPPYQSLPVKRFRVEESSDDSNSERRDFSRLGLIVPTVTPAKSDRVTSYNDVHVVPKTLTAWIEVNPDVEKNNPIKFIKRIRHPPNSDLTSDLSTSPSTNSDSSQRKPMFIPIDLKAFAPIADASEANCSGPSGLAVLTEGDPALSSGDPTLTSMSLRCLESLSSDCSPVSIESSETLEQVPEIESLPDAYSNGDFHTDTRSKQPSMTELEYLDQLMY